MRYVLAGYGRMGREIERVAALRGHACVAVLDPAVGTASGARGAALAASHRAEVAFEFTSAAAAGRNVEALLRAGISVVCGTTGWDPAAPRIEAALRSGGAGLVAEPNFSVGMHLFAQVVAQAARAFGAAGLYDAWIEEAHHRGKIDAPSGTARQLAQLVLAADPRLRAVRTAAPRGALPEGVLPVTSVRAGHEPGVHTVGFDGEDDVVTLTHRARGRGGFALGAVLAAEWLKRRPGRHRLADVLAGLGEARPRGRTPRPAPSRRKGVRA